MRNQKGYNKQHKVTETNTRIKELNSIKTLIAKNSYGGRRELHEKRYTSKLC